MNRIKCKEILLNAKKEVTVSFATHLLGHKSSRTPIQSNHFKGQATGICPIGYTPYGINTHVTNNIRNVLDFLLVENDD